jgi:hypothetical protein
MIPTRRSPRRQTGPGRLFPTAALSFALLVNAAAGCAGTGERTRTDGDPGYLAAGPTVGLDESGSGKPTALELLDRRNRELAAARDENARLAEEKARLESEGLSLGGELADWRARAETAEAALALSKEEMKPLKESLVRSRLLNVRLTQHLARLDLDVDESGIERPAARPEPLESAGAAKKGGDK